MKYVVSSQVEREEKLKVYAKMRLLSKMVHGMSERLMRSELKGLGFELGIDPADCYIIATGLTSKALAHYPDGNFNYYEIAPLMHEGAERIVQEHGFKMAHFFDVSTDLWNIIVSEDMTLSGDKDAGKLAHALQDCIQGLCGEAVLRHGGPYCVVTAMSDHINGYEELKTGFDQVCRLRRLDFFHMESTVIDSEWYDSMHRQAGRIDVSEVLHSLNVCVADGRPEAIPYLMKALTDHLKSSLDLRLVDDIGSVLNHYILNSEHSGKGDANGRRRKRLSSSEYPTLDALTREAEIRLKDCAQAVSRVYGQFCPVTRSAMRYIQVHFLENPSQQEIAQAVGVVPQYLSSVFNRDMGVGVPAYVNRLRIREAQALLRNTEMKVSEIAEYIGMTNTDGFYAMFRRMTGMSATAYRAQYGKRAPQRNVMMKRE